MRWATQSARSAFGTCAWPISSGNSTFSVTSSTGIRLNDWKMKPSTWWRRSVTARSVRPAVSVSITRTVPSVGVSMQPIMFRIVVLPDPDGPAMETKSPSSISKLTPLTAWTSVLPSG